MMIPHRDEYCLEQLKQPLLSPRLAHFLVETPSGLTAHNVPADSNGQSLNNRGVTADISLACTGRPDIYRLPFPVTPAMTHTCHIKHVTARANQIPARVCRSRSEDTSPRTSLLIAPSVWICGCSGWQLTGSGLFRWGVRRREERLCEGTMRQTPRLSQEGACRGYGFGLCSCNGPFIIANYLTSSRNIC